MGPIAIALIVFVCVFGGALFGMFMSTLLPAHHLTDASKDLVRVVMGLVATLAALVLGLLVASAKTSFDTANDAFRQSAAKVILLDRALEQYGPESKDLRESIRKSVAARLEQLFPKDGSQRSTLSSSPATAAVEGVQQRLRALSPQTDSQRAMQSRAVEIADAVAQARWLVIEQEDNTIPSPFLVVLVFWLAVMFATFGLFAPRNATTVAMLFLGAASLAAAIFLIEELYDPFGGVISISSAPMHKAIAILGQ